MSYNVRPEQANQVAIIIDGYKYYAKQDTDVEFDGPRLAFVCADTGKSIVTTKPYFLTIEDLDESR